MTTKEWELIDRYMTGIITEEEFSLLQTLLYQSAELRAEFRKAASLDIALHDMHSMDPKLGELLAFDFSNAPKPIQGPAEWWGRDIVWRMVAAIALLFAIGQFVFSLRVSPDQQIAQNQTAKPPAPAPVSIAKVIHTENCVWVNPKKALAEGASISAGEVELISGTFVFAINNGPRIALTGPAKLNLYSEHKAHLDHGYLSFQNFYNSNSFDLTTPKSLLTDIGTEYAVSVNAGGEVIHVVGGEVWRTNLKEEDDISFLGKGETGVFGPNQDADKLLSYIKKTARFLQETDDALRKPFVSDSFDYDSTEGKAKNELNGGTGWQSPWEFQIRELDKSLPKIQRLNTAPGLPADSAATKALSISGDSIMKRQLTESINMDADATYYVSLLYNTSAFTSTDHMMLLLKLKDSLNKKDLTIGINKDKQIICRFDRSYRSQVPVEVGGTMLFVAKITAHKNEQDTIDITLLDPAADLSSEPIAWSLRAGFDLSQSRWGTFGLHVFTEKPVIVDEVRISNTWRGLFN